MTDIEFWKRYSAHVVLSAGMWLWRLVKHYEWQHRQEVVVLRAFRDWGKGS